MEVHRMQKCITWMLRVDYIGCIIEKNRGASKIKKLTEIVRLNSIEKLRRIGKWRKIKK
jgi:hypothetical protein